jgi:hypothetical protein
LTKGNLLGKLVMFGKGFPLRGSRAVVSPCQYIREFDIL